MSACVQSEKSTGNYLCNAVKAKARSQGRGWAVRQICPLATGQTFRDKNFLSPVIVFIQRETFLSGHLDPFTFSESRKDRKSQIDWSDKRTNFHYPCPKKSSSFYCSLSVEVSLKQFNHEGLIHTASSEQLILRSATWTLGSFNVDYNLRCINWHFISEAGNV